MQIHIDKLINSLQEIYYDYDFKITVHKDGSADLKIPDFILCYLKESLESGFGTPRSEVRDRLTRG